MRQDIQAASIESKVTAARFTKAIKGFFVLTAGLYLAILFKAPIFMVPTNRVDLACIWFSLILLSANLVVAARMAPDSKEIGSQTYFTNFRAKQVRISVVMTIVTMGFAAMMMMALYYKETGFFSINVRGIALTLTYVAVLAGLNIWKSEGEADWNNINVLLVLNLAMLPCLVIFSPNIAGFILIISAIGLVINYTFFRMAKSNALKAWRFNPHPDESYA